MSESNNNIPMRITQLEEATAYEDGMYYPVAKAGKGTKKIDINKLSPKLQSITSLQKNKIIGFLSNAIALDSGNESVSISAVAGTTVLFECKEGETYTFSTEGTQNRYLWAFFESYPSVGDSTDKYKNSASSTITAPLTGYGAYYILNSTSAELVAESQIEIGTEATTIEPPSLTAIDFVLRNKLNEISGTTKNLILGNFGKALTKETNSVKISNVDATTLFFECKANTKYTFSTSEVTNRFLWAFFENYPSVLDTTSYYIETAENTIEAPIDGYGLYYCYNSVNQDIINKSQINEGEAPSAFVEHKNTSFDFGTMAILDKVRNPNRYNKMLSIGDSLTNAKGDGLLNGFRWQNEVSKIIGLQSWTTGGTSGSTVADVMTNSIYDSVQAMTLDSDVDIITFWGGTNDYTYAVEIGVFEEQLPSETRDNETFYGALISCIEKIMTLYPSKRFILIGTTPRILDVSTGKNYHNQPNGKGYYLKDYVDAVKTTAEYFGIPFLDLLRSSGINLLNISQYMFEQTSGQSQIYLHFSNQGEILIGNRIGAFISSLG